jgi:hypothetical protein
MKYKTENTNRIVWQKWFDPFGEDDIEAIEAIEENNFDSEETEVYNGEETEFDNDLDQEEQTFYKRPTRVVLTPMGMIPYTDNTASSKIFNFWVGHTNFDLTPVIVKKIELIEGVETLDVFTRYRFRVGIGKLFDSAFVMSSIAENIYDYLDDIGD